MQNIKKITKKSIILAKSSQNYEENPCDSLRY